MMLVHPNNEDFLEDAKNFEEIGKKIVETKDQCRPQVKYLARDGLTPPTKSIRTRFFRKDFNVSPEKIREVEDEMFDILNEIKDNKKGDYSDTRSVVSNNNGFDEDKEMSQLKIIFE